MTEPVWYTTPRWRSGHLLIETTTPEGAEITLCGRRSRPDDEWAEDNECAVRCGQCARLYAIEHAKENL